MAGHLSSKELERLAAEAGLPPPHVADCKRCAQNLHRVRGRRRLLSALGQRDGRTLAPDALARVERRTLEALSVPAPTRWLWLALPLAAAAALIAVLLLRPAGSEAPAATNGVVASPDSSKERGRTPESLAASPGAETGRPGAEVNQTPESLAAARPGAETGRTPESLAARPGAETGRTPESLAARPGAEVNQTPESLAAARPGAETGRTPESLAAARPGVEANPAPESPSTLANRTSLAPGRARLSWLEGAVKRDGEALPLDAALAEGDLLTTGDGLLRLELSGGARCVLEPRGAVRLATLRQGDTVLRLEAGRVGCQVPPLASRQRFAVDAGARRVAVVGTRFAVARFASEVVVEVTDGTVWVSDGPRYEHPRAVSAPTALRFDDGAPASGGTRAAPVALSRPQLLTRASGAARMRIQRQPEGVQVQLDELGWGTAPLEAWVEPGRHRLRLKVVGSPPVERWVEVPAGTAPFDVVLPSLEPVLPDRTGDPEALTEVSTALRAHTPELRECYEEWLKRNEAARGRVVLTLELSERGAVTAARADDAVLPADVARCMVSAARKWALPALGAPVELQVPLDLTAVPAPP